MRRLFFRLAIIARPVSHAGFCHKMNAMVRYLTSALAMTTMWF